MTPTMHPRLVNGRFGDPALFVELMHRREALLFDCGNLSALASRDLLRIGHVYVSHMHMDHFVGLDALVRVSIGRQRELRVTGPCGLIAKLHHRLQGYEWDLVHRYDADFTIHAVELGEQGEPRGAARFRFLAAFAREEEEIPDAIPAPDGLTVKSKVLEHHGPSAGYAAMERAHANVWRNRLGAMDLEPGPWLNALKAALLHGSPDETRIMVAPERSMVLADLRPLVSISRGQKLAYVTDVADTAANRAAIADLARGADMLFLEARFAAADEDRARERAHLTTRAAGEIARAADVRRFEPFHFSPRYPEEQEEELVAEALVAFRAG